MRPEVGPAGTLQISWKTAQQDARCPLQVGDSAPQGHRFLRMVSMPVHAIPLPGRRPAARAVKAADGPAFDCRGLATSFRAL